MGSSEGSRILEKLGFEILSNWEMLKVRGGTDSKPKTRESSTDDLGEE